MAQTPNRLNDNQTQITAWQAQLSRATPSEVLLWASGTFGNRLAFATSLGAEDQIITHLLAKVSPQIRIFTLDSGRLFPETYDLIDRTEAHYAVKIEVYSPNSEEVESMVREHGINLFYKSVDFRKLCCTVRKLHSLQRALSGADAWICGLRRDQAVTRQDIHVIEWDDQNQLVKINPLCSWSEKDAWDFIRANKVPYNPLHDQGFLSIGCSCCTRAVAPGEDIRAGRWWWESPEQKECGLHRLNGKLQEAKVFSVTS